MADLMKELKRQEEKLSNCVHCGFCLPACPTYTRLGDEADSPRGRLHFMRALVDGRLSAGSPALLHHLDRCLGCRACESVCPSGVEYGRLLEGARQVTVSAGGAGLLARLLPEIMARRGILRLAMFLARALRATGLPRAAAVRLPEGGWLGQAKLGMGMIASTAAPRLLGRSGSGPNSEGRDSVGPHRVGLLVGCVQEGLLGRVNRATVRVLEANGFQVLEVSGQGCCGAIHAHTGDLEGARRLARQNVRAFSELSLDFLVVNAAGCGAAMKEYPHLLQDDTDHAERARDLAGRVRDVSEILGGQEVVEGGRLELRVTYDAPCHLVHAQRISKEPLTLLDRIPGLERVPLKGEDECCGGAGIYGITHPELGGRISRDKIDAILDTGAQVVATGNPGCMMQIGAGLAMGGFDVDVVHPVELLDESYRRGGVYS